MSACGATFEQMLLDALKEHQRYLVACYAHELAEKQRAAISDDSPAWVKVIPDLIDPEAQPERRLCGWEQAHEAHRWIQNGIWYLCSTVVVNSDVQRP